MWCYTFYANLITSPFDLMMIKLSYIVYMIKICIHMCDCSLSLSLWNMKFAQLSFLRPKFMSFSYGNYFCLFAKTKWMNFIMSANNFFPNNFTSKRIWIFSSSLILEIFALNFPVNEIFSQAISAWWILAKCINYQMDSANVYGFRVLISCWSVSTQIIVTMN